MVGVLCGLIVNKVLQIHAEIFREGLMLIEAMEVLTIFGSSVLAFILGVFIGVSLGYMIWATKT